MRCPVCEFRPEMKPVKVQQLAFWEAEDRHTVHVCPHCWKGVRQ